MPKILWSLRWNHPPRGLALARESGHLLLWDDANWITLFDASGRRQGQVHRPRRIAAAAISEDGSAVACADSDGVCWLGPDLYARWEQPAGTKPLAVAFDAQGEVLVCSDSAGHVRAFERMGNLVGEAQSPRPVHQMAVSLSDAEVLCAGEYGYVASLDLFTKTWRWRDTPVVHHGSVALVGADGSALVACFSDGVRGYDREGRPLKFEEPLPPCRSLCTSYDGTLIVAGGLDTQLYAADRRGRRRFQFNLDGPATALGLDSLGARLFATVGTHAVVCFDLPV